MRNTGRLGERKEKSGDRKVNCKLVINCENDLPDHGHDVRGEGDVLEAETLGNLAH